MFFAMESSVALEPQLHLPLSSSPPLRLAKARVWANSDVENRAWRVIPPNLKTEADVESKLVHSLLRDPLQLGIPDDNIRDKHFLVPTALDKKAGKTSGYIPDFAVTVGALPLLIIEAKSPDTDPEVGYREAGLYAFHLNKQFKAGINPCQRILATNGKRILAGAWDSAPTVDIRVRDLVSGAAGLSDLKELCSYAALSSIYNRIAPSLRPKMLAAPYSLSGGNSLLNAKRAPNTFAAPLSPVLKRYFSSKQQNTDREIYQKAYVTSDEITTYDDTLRTLLRERIVELRGTTSKTLTPTARAESNVAKVIRESRGMNAGDLQLITGGVGSGKSLFVRRYKELLQAADQRDLTHWAFVDFNVSPSDLKSAEAWMCETFVESFRVENGFDALASENWSAVFAVELNRRKAIYDDIAVSSPEQAKMARANDLSKWIDDPCLVAKGVSRYFQGDQCEKGHTVVVVMDNVDRLGKDEQLEVFRLSLWFMNQTRCFVILNLRDDTFERFKNEPPLDTYRTGVTFHIQPPKFIDVVRKRLELSAAYLADEVSDRLEYRTESLRFTYPKSLVGEFLKELYLEIFERHHNLAQVIQGLAGRDVRKALAIFESVLRSGHLSEEAITSKLRGAGSFEVNQDVILKTLMRGEYQFHSSHSGFVANLFYVDAKWERPSSFLVIDIVFWLWVKRKSVGPLRIQGYFSVAWIARELELRGYIASDVINACGFCLAQGLVEADHFGRDLQGEDDNIKITYSGFVHLRLLLDRLEYLYGVLPTTPFFNRTYAESVSKTLDREASGAEVPWVFKLQAVELLFRHLKEQHAAGVISFPQFGGADTGASYVLDRIERTIEGARGRKLTPSPNLMDSL